MTNTLAYYTKVYITAEMFYSIGPPFFISVIACIDVKNSLENN